MVDSNTTSDTSLALLNQAHALLARPIGDQPDIRQLLADLMNAASATAAGLVSCPDATEVFVHPDRQPPLESVSWLRESGWVAHIRQAPAAIAIENSHGTFDLVAGIDGPEETYWLLWLEPGTGRADWTDADAAAVRLVGIALGRLSRTRPGPRWGEQLERASRQQRLEAAATITRRLAHDFGNILTGILGFTELALAQQIPTGSPLLSYLQESQRAAQTGAQFTHQLRLFSRRQSVTSRSSNAALVLSELETSLFANRDEGIHFRIELSTDLPPVALDHEQFRQVLGAILENSQQALGSSGAVSVFGRALELTSVDCAEFYGDVRPGRHVEIVVADTGSGLTTEAMQRLFVEPFFSTKPRRRGFGLAIAYGILHAHKGGLRLHPGEERGVVARVVLPAAVAMSMAPTTAPRSGEQGKNERTLVLDDNIEVLNYIVTSLKRSGFQPIGFTDASAALEAYFQDGPFAVVLTDVLMAPMGGVEFVHRLLRRDPSAQVIFMSGQVSADFLRQDFVGKSFEFLAKPFRPEQLNRILRAALDRPARKPSAPALSGTAKH